MNKIVVYPKIINKIDCAEFINSLDLNTWDQSYFSGYTMDYGIKKKRCDTHPLVNTICSLLGYKIDSASLVYYPTNSYNGLHCDNSVVEGDMIKQVKPWKRTSIIFLNDNFTGGDLVYPDQGCIFKSTIGTIVEAPAGYDYMHYVSEVTAGERYTLVMRINN
jgi:hypothetical protein